ncbi:hypothetical protein EC957_008876 [Mortierella hygrophila]|uniref:Uncharacterized protein n=1 Tax=Mortierella hygrophila TaxID=979708 RepID=A0A9P6EX82_9FUNG|nr:hypothetical protein EC957_008876 [Mortierella hygrophila]
MSSDIPVYNQACLATDSSSTAPSFYLVGSNLPGSLEVNYINNPDATTYTQVANKSDQSSWTPTAAKLGIKIVQFGSGTTYMALAQTSNIVSSANSFRDSGFISPKLFSWSGKAQDFDMFTVVTNETVTNAPKPGMWGNVMMNFQVAGTSLLSYDMTHDPVAVDNALLAVGTYGDSFGSISHGYTIVFDKAGKGQIFTATGNLLATVTNNIPALTLGIPESVKMSEISLTVDAIPITMGTTAYILDKADNGTTVIYSINPSTSTTLNRVYNTGDSLQFTNNMAAAALNNQLLTYSVNRNVASFNVFDVATSSWSGAGLVSAPVSGPTSSPTAATSSPTSMGAIAASAVGGLFLIAIAVLLFVRCRRRRQRQNRQKCMERTDFAHLQGPEANMYNGGAAPQRHAQYDIQGYIQYEQGYVPYDPQEYQHLPQNQHPSSPFIPPPPFNQGGVDDLPSCKVPQPISTGSSSVDSSLVRDSSYISPTSYRESFSFAPKSIDSALAISESEGRSSFGQIPQYVPSVVGGAGSEVRSPQMVPSTSSRH